MVERDEKERKRDMAKYNVIRPKVTSRQQISLCEI